MSQEVIRLAASYPADLGYRNDVVFPAVLEMLSHGSEIGMECLGALLLREEQQLSPSKASRGEKLRYLIHTWDQRVAR